MPETVTRIAQAGFETRYWDEYSIRSFNPVYTNVTSSSPKTGSYALAIRSDGFHRYGGWDVPSASHVRVGLHFMSVGDIAGSGVGVSPCPYLIRFDDPSGNKVGGIRISGERILFIDVNGSQVATGSTFINVANSIDNYLHVGVDFLVSTSGWAALYIDGVLEALYEGNTSGGGSTIGRVYAPYIPINSTPDWIYLDDVIVDQVDGASAYSAPPDRRLIPIPASTTGASSNWDVIGASVNVEAVDDWTSGSADDDATYVSTSVAETVDFYYGQEITASTIAASNTIEALIVQARALKTDAAASTQLRLAVRRGQGASSLSPGKDLPSSWGVVWHRFTSDPSTGAPWADYVAINETEMGIEGEP